MFIDHEFVFRALEQIGGLEYENEYPYLAKKENECHFNKTMSRVAVSGAVDLPKNETAMQQWLVANGPISIGTHLQLRFKQYHIT